VALSVQDGASYYLLGYSPEGKADSKYHKIEVKVNPPSSGSRVGGVTRSVNVTPVAPGDPTASHADSASAVCAFASSPDRPA